MATPRRAWFRAAEILAHEPISKEELGVLYSLMAAMNRQWARDGLSQEEAGEILLTKAHIFDVTGRFRLRSARNLLVKLGVNVKITIELQGDNTLVRWPKFPIFQQYPPGMRAETTLRSPESASAPASAPAKGKKSRAKRAPKSPPPEWTLGIAQELERLLQTHDPGAPTEGRLGGWAREIAKIQLPPEDIRSALQWVFSPANRDSKYRFVVQSGKKLHDNMGKIQAQMTRSQPEENPHVRNAKSVLAARVNGAQTAGSSGAVYDMQPGERGPGDNADLPLGLRERTR